MNKYLEKIAKELNKKPQQAKGYIPKEHHSRVLKKLETQDGILVDHSVGSGKTGLFLKAIENAQKKDKNAHALVIAPASLVSNVHRQAKDLGIDIDPARLEALSYEKAVNEADRLKKKKFAIAVADEGHKLRNTSTARHQHLSEVISAADKRLIATATPTYNHASDISALVNLAAGGRVLPQGKKDFDERFVDKKVEQPPLLKRIFGHGPKEVHVLKNKKELTDKLNKYVDRYDLRDDPEAADKFPKQIETVIETPMSSEQHALYKYMEGRLPWHLRLKVRMNMPLDKKESSQLNAFSTGVRQVSNSIKPFMPKSQGTTPKISKAVDNLQSKHKSDKNFRGVVYSNYIDAGLNDYSEELTRRKIKHAVYTGKLSAAEKDKMVEDYNSGKTKVLLISSSGAEGLNLKGTKLIQVLEPHHNESKVKQVIGRGNRYESHAHLPAKERKLEVERYHTVFPNGIFGKPKTHSIDQYLHHNSQSKDELSEELKSLIKS